MVKKVSKHSRAARRLEAEDIEAQTLAQLPRAENVDLTNKLIRTASKNEQLLEAKMKKKDRSSKMISKKATTKNGPQNMDHDRLERALNINSRLDGKVQKAKSRAKYVQNARKAGWDVTNESIRRDLALLTGSKPATNAVVKTTEAEKMEEDIDPTEEQQEVEEHPQKETSNAFDLLADDVEA